MKKDALLTAVAAVVVATGVALLAKALLTPAAPEPVTVVEKPADVVPQSRILVAAQDIQPGQFLDSAMLQWQAVDADQVKPLQLLQNQFRIESVRGATIRAPLVAGTAITEAMLIRAGDAGFLATVLQADMRAVSIPTSAVESSFGLISAGDHVDVILSLTNQGSNSDNSSPFLKSQTILRNARVLALNNRIDTLAPGNQPKDAKAVRSFSTVTLEVRPQVAEQLSIAKELGDLMLALRPLNSSDDGQTSSADSRITTVTDTTRIYQPSKQAVINAYRGDALEPIALAD